MDFDGAAGRGTLYRLDPDWTCTPVVAGVAISNGIDWSPDGSVMYYVDTALSVSICLTSTWTPGS